MKSSSIMSTDLAKSKTVLYQFIIQNVDGERDLTIAAAIEAYGVRIDVGDFIKQAKKGIEGVSCLEPEKVILDLMDRLIRNYEKNIQSSFNLDDIFIAINSLPSREAKLPYVKQALDRKTSFGRVIWNLGTTTFSDNVEIYKRIYKSVRQYFHPNYYDQIAANEEIQKIMNDFFEKQLPFDWEKVLTILEEHCINPNVRYFVSVKSGSHVSDRIERNLADVFIHTPDKGTSAITTNQLKRLLALGLDPNDDCEKKDSMLDCAARMISQEQAFLLLAHGAAYRKNKITLLDKLVEDKSKLLPGDIFKDVTHLVKLLNYHVELKNLHNNKWAFYLIVTWLSKHANIKDITPSICVNLKPFKKQLFEAIKEMPINTQLEILKTVIEDDGVVKTSALGSVFWEGHTDPSRGNLKGMFEEYEKLRNPTAPTGFFARLFSGSSKVTVVEEPRLDSARKSPLLRRSSDDYLM